MTAPENEYCYGTINQCLQIGVGEHGALGVNMSFYDHPMCGSLMRVFTFTLKGKYLFNSRDDSYASAHHIPFPEDIKRKIRECIRCQERDNYSKRQLYALFCALGIASREEYTPSATDDIWNFICELPNARGGRPLKVDMDEIFPLRLPVLNARDATAAERLRLLQEHDIDPSVFDAFCEHIRALT